ncbi:lytic transglycosylase domain-containing protein [Zavarzinia compransoris]|uniref:lytic transglycosylase domain-containing protein n=1 Tax=Zavarzinia marina TaxID=2911065 RepID=UPI001F44CFD7|nr:lytic transglycosylase domain-containing protein [Zavarzinia marina]MCF4164780.1 lytic transglycosylase domain-containing protein [Zavarzinia marina]
MSVSSLLLACVLNASQLYGVPPAGIMAVMRAEGGTTGAVSENGNGSRDIGPMQVNSLWLPVLAEGWGVDEAAAEAALRDRPCTNVAVGTWILADCIRRRGGDFWAGVGCYHAPSNDDRARAYAGRVADRATELFGSRVFRKPPPLHRNDLTQ